jgi:hypothetical protein
MYQIGNREIRIGPAQPALFRGRLKHVSGQLAIPVVKESSQAGSLDILAIQHGQQRRCVRDPHAVSV